MRNGDFMISRSNIHDDVILRPVIANPKTSEETLDGLIDEVLRVGSDIVAGRPSRSEYVMPQYCG
jgi:hypothetical protein